MSISSHCGKCGFLGSVEYPILGSGKLQLQFAISLIHVLQLFSGSIRQQRYKFHWNPNNNFKAEIVALTFICSAMEKDRCCLLPRGVFSSNCLWREGDRASNTERERERIRKRTGTGEKIPLGRRRTRHGLQPKDVRNRSDD